MLPSSCSTLRRYTPRLLLRTSTFRIRAICHIALLTSLTTNIEAIITSAIVHTGIRARGRPRGLTSVGRFRWARLRRYAGRIYEDYKLGRWLTGKCLPISSRDPPSPVVRRRERRALHMLVCLGRDWPCRVSPVRRSRLSTWPLQRGVRDAFEDDQIG